MAGLEVLVDEQQYGGITVRPLTLGKLVRLAPDFATLKALCVDNALTLETVLVDPIRVATILSPVAPRLLAVVTDHTEAEVNEWPLDTALGVLVIALRQNLGYIRKLLGPVLATALREVAESTPTQASSGPSKDSSHADTTSMPSSGATA